MSNYRWLRITDGTTYTSGHRREVNLLNCENGFCLTSWQVGIAQGKGGGTWADSALSDGRRLKVKKRQNVEHTLTLEVRGFDADDLAYQTQQLRQLLTAAEQYWTASWTTYPVYIETQGVGETNMGYSLIKDWTTPNGADKYSDTFWQGVASAGVTDFDIILEVEPYIRSNPPGEGDCLELGTIQEAVLSYPLEFDGASGNVNCGSPAKLDNLPNNDFTVDGWIRADGYGENNNGRIASKGDVWSVSVVNFGSLEAFADYDVTNAYSWGTGTIADGEWHHVAFVFAAGVTDTWSIYIDGTEVTYGGGGPQAGANAYVGDAATSLYLGNNSAGTRTFDGGIGWLRVSVNQRWLANFTPPPRCPIPATDVNTRWLGIYEGSGATANDLSATPADGTITTATWGSGCTEWFGNYDTVSSTREQTCAADTVYIANKHNYAQLTHAMYYDAAPGVWSANFLATGLSYSLLPAAPAANDTIYVGIESTIPKAGPFCSMVYDLVAMTGTVTFASSGGSYWQYWNGAWTYIATQDNTNAGGANTGQPFDTSGPGSIHWLQPSDWAVSTVNGVTAYWMRCVVSAVSGTVTAPVQQNRQIYSILWPYIEVQDDKVGGDVSNLLRLYLRNQSSGGAYAPSLGTTKWVMGLRSLSRGADFTAFLNASDTQQPSGITFSAGTYSTVQNDLTAPTGRSYTWAPGAFFGGWSWLGSWNIDATIDDQFFGTFHAFLRILRTGGTGTIQARLYCTMLSIGSTGDETYSSQVATVMSDSTIYEEALDLGQIHIPPGPLLSTDTTNGVHLVVEASSTTATDAMTVYDLVIIPVDEMAMDTDVVATASGLGLSYTTLLDLDSITVPKLSKRAVRRLVSDNSIYGGYQTAGAGEVFLQSRTDQRLWIMSSVRGMASTVPNHPLIEESHSVQVWNVERFWWMRGAE